MRGPQRPGHKMAKVGSEACASGVVFLFVFFSGHAPRSLWDLSSLTRDRTRARDRESAES